MRRAPRPSLTLLAVLPLAIAVNAGGEPRRAWGVDEARWDDALAAGDFDAFDAVVRAPRAPALRGSSGGSGRSPIAWLSLSARVMAPHETAFFATLGVAWDRATARAATRRTALADPPAPPPTRPDAPRMPPPPPPEIPSPALVLGPHLARAVIASALRAAGLGAADAAIDRMISRARWSAMLPEVRLRGSTVDTARQSATLSQDSDPTHVYDSLGDSRLLEARLTWRLDRLLFAEDEPGLERLRVEHREAKLRLSARVLEVLFQWQRAILDRELSTEGTRDRLEASLRAIEAESSLDVLTAGWFSAWVAEARRPPNGRAPPRRPP